MSASRRYTPPLRRWQNLYQQDMKHPDGLHLRVMLAQDDIPHTISV
jgi:hypothetical protein